LEEWSKRMMRCEYFLVQYVPFPREEMRLPIGLILLEAGGSLFRHAMTRNWQAVRCLDPYADLALIEALPDFLETIVKEHAGAQGLSASGLRRELARLAESDLGTVRVSSPRGVETEDLSAEFERLFEEQVAIRRPPAARPAPRAGSRRWIQQQLRGALQRSPVWTRLRSNVPVEEFTAPGDRFQIDFSYRPNGQTKYLHALSLERDWNQAKVLSYTFQRICSRMPAALTAVVAEADPRRNAAQSCRQILLDAGIALHPLAELHALVERMQGELGAVI
jgi:hypothetical protein